jgi:hypothetical protein
VPETSDINRNEKKSGYNDMSRKLLLTPKEKTMRQERSVSKGGQAGTSIPIPTSRQALRLNPASQKVDSQQPVMYQ